MRTSLGNFPRVFSTKNGQALRLQILKAHLERQFIEAYLAFRPRNSFQGLPPLEDVACAEWAQNLIDTGINLVAVSPTAGIVGHTALFPIDDVRCEMLVVVWPPFQNIGIGFELTRGCVQMACELGYRQMWLPVEATNLRARHIYSKCGFEYRSSKPASELDMVCDLIRYRAIHEKDDFGDTPAPLGIPMLPIPMSTPTMV
jgi:RimJ/RimL family protein N-acetyltransferase